MRKIILFLSVFVCSVGFSDTAPDSAKGAAAYLRITAGTGYLASFGSAIAYTSFDSNLYSLLGENNVTDAFGNYTWTKTNENTALITLYDAVTQITLTYQLKFQTEDGGTFSVSDPNIGTQRGTFEWFSIVLPSELPDSISINQPSIDVKNGKIEIKLSIEKSENLSTWTRSKGTVSVNEEGVITITTDAGEDASFYKVRFEK